MNKKARHIGKRKVGSSARKRLRKLHTSEYENSFFIKKKKIVLYFKEDTIDSEKLQSTVSSLTSREQTVQAAPSKKKSHEREREREEERVRTGGKRRRKMRRKMRKGKKRRKKRKKNEESGTKVFEYTAPSRCIP